MGKPLLTLPGSDSTKTCDCKIDFQTAWHRVNNRGLMVRDGAFAPPHHEVWLPRRSWRPHAEERRLPRVSKDGPRQISPARNRLPAAQIASESCKRVVPLKTEGAGKAGCPLHPQPGVRKMKAHQHSH